MIHTLLSAKGIKHKNLHYRDFTALSCEMQKKGCKVAFIRRANITSLRVILSSAFSGMYIT